MPYSQQLAQRVKAQLGKYPETVEKKMFGGVGYLINGNMACGVNGDYLIVRLPPEQHEQALREPGVKPFDMTGKPMKGWVMVGPDGIAEEAALRRWVESGVSFASSLKPK